MVQNIPLVVWGRPVSGKSFITHLFTGHTSSHATNNNLTLPLDAEHNYYVCLLRGQIEEYLQAPKELIKLIILTRDPRASWVAQLSGMPDRKWNTYITHIDNYFSRENLKLILHYRDTLDSLLLPFEDTLQNANPVVDKINQHTKLHFPYVVREEKFNDLITKSDAQKIASNGISKRDLNRLFKYISDKDKDFIDYFGYPPNLTVDEILDPKFCLVRRTAS
jgi:hypothetical protein